jgi:hypothetical protein
MRDGFWMPSLEDQSVKIKLEENGPTSNIMLLFENVSHRRCLLTVVLFLDDVFSFCDSQDGNGNVHGFIQQNRRFLLPEMCITSTQGTGSKFG